MKTFKEVKKLCDEKVKDFPDLEERYKKEIFAFKRFFDNERDILNEFEENRERIDNRYVIPFLLGYTDKVDLEKPLDMIQVKPGASGGIDIDSDFEPKAKEEVARYLKERFGEDRVISVGTYTRMGVPSAAKDLLRIYEIPFKDSNAFTSELEATESWEQNLERFKSSRPDLYAFYEKHKEILDLVPYFINKVRQTGKHAGGICVLDRPVYELVPIDRVSGNIVTAFPESGQIQTLDECGIVKLDVLGISILDVVSNAIDSINEKMFLIEDDDGINKIVPESYINDKIKKL